MFNKFDSCFFNKLHLVNQQQQLDGIKLHVPVTSSMCLCLEISNCRHVFCGGHIGQILLMGFFVLNLELHFVGRSGPETPRW